MNLDQLTEALNTARNRDREFAELKVALQQQTQALVDILGRLEKQAQANADLAAAITKPLVDAIKKMQPPTVNVPAPAAAVPLPTPAPQPASFSVSAERTVKGFEMTVTRH